MNTTEIATAINEIKRNAELLESYYRKLDGLFDFMPENKTLNYREIRKYRMIAETLQALRLISHQATFNVHLIDSDTVEAMTK